MKRYSGPLALAMIAGAFLFTSLAALPSASAATNGTIKVNAVKINYCTKFKCDYEGSYSNLYVSARSSGLVCNGYTVPNGSYRNFGYVRTLSCEHGQFDLKLAYADSLPNGTPATVHVTLHSGITEHISLGSSR